MPRLALFCMLCASAAAACSAPPEPVALPPGVGLASFDRQAQPGAETFERPTWLEGDRFVFRKGGRARLRYRVSEVHEGGYRLLDEDRGSVLELDRDLGEVAQLPPPEGFAAPGAEGAATPQGSEVRMDPVDARFSWPLWVGKRWTASFTRRTAGQPDLALVASYHCDAREEVTVPAGTFDCLRIWRRVALSSELAVPDRTLVLWYAPEAGFAVRILDDAYLSELEELQRQ